MWHYALAEIEQVSDELFSAWCPRHHKRSGSTKGWNFLIHYSCGNYRTRNLNNYLPTGLQWEIYVMIQCKVKNESNSQNRPFSYWHQTRKVWCSTKLNWLVSSGEPIAPRVISGFPHLTSLWQRSIRWSISLICLAKKSFGLILTDLYMRLSFWLKEFKSVYFLDCFWLMGG